MWFEQRTRTYRTRPLKGRHGEQLNETQAKVAGFDLAAMQAAHALLIGAGGIGTSTATALVRKGLGQLTTCDDDLVEVKNLTRQLYSRDDVNRLKSHCLARNLARAGLFPSTLISLPFRFQELLERGYDFGKVSVLIAGVDNNPSRKAACIYGLEQGVPVIHAAVSRAGNELYVMVQEPGKACWGCAFAHAVNDAQYPCNLPGILDVLQVVSGMIVYAVDSLIADRPRHWNVREVFLDGSLPDRTRTVERRADCALCGSPAIS